MKNNDTKAKILLLAAILMPLAFLDLQKRSIPKGTFR